MKFSVIASLLAMFLAVALPPNPAQASDFHDHVVNSTSRGIAMDGFDPVAYFTQNKPAKGDQAHRATFKGRVWVFANAENKAAFEAAPEKFAPQNNGWCAWAVAHGYAAEVDFLDGWFIADDKLYVTWSAEVKDRFLKNKNQLLQQSQANWSTVHEGLLDGSVKFGSHAQRPALGFSHPQQLPES
ncbi:hypothetical protein K3727_10815 [Rhodobacteraceae bacterium M382]|nr:hypothetical protein K3727_10815 [Rhodobacteraceae bacterium M382]